MGSTQTKAKKKYNEKNYYRISLAIPKAWEEKIRERARENDESVNGLLKGLIDDAINGRTGGVRNPSALGDAIKEYAEAYESLLALVSDSSFRERAAYGFCERSIVDCIHEYAMLDAILESLPEKKRLNFKKNLEEVNKRYWSANDRCLADKKEYGGRKDRLEEAKKRLDDLLKPWET